MLTSLLAVLAMVQPRPIVHITQEPLPEAQKQAISQASELSSDELKKAGWTRFEVSGVLVVVHKSCFPFQAIEELTTGLNELKRAKFQKGIATVSAKGDGVIQQMIKHLVPGLQASEFGIMPATRLVIEVKGERRVVDADRPGIHQSFPTAELKQNGSPGSEPPLPWPDLSLKVPDKLSLSFIESKDSSITASQGYAIALAELDARIKHSTSGLRAAFDECFRIAQDSDPDYFGSEPLKPGGMNGLSDSLLAAIAMRTQSHADIIRQEGQIVKVVRSISLVVRFKDANGNWSSMIRDLPILPPDGARKTR